MSPRHGNLADPEYEPTDEELQELSRSAFADVAAKSDEALRQVHARIAELRAELRQKLKARAVKQWPEAGE